YALASGRSWAAEQTLQQPRLGDVPRRGLRAAVVRVSVGSLCRHELGWGHLLAGWGELGHGAFGEVAAVADLPFVVGLDEDRPARRSSASGLGKTPTTSVRRLIS